MFILKLMLINERIIQLYIKNTSRCSSSTCYFHLVMCVMCPTSSEENTAALSILLRWELLAMKAERYCSANQNIIVHFRVGSGVFFWHLQKISHSGSKKKENWGKKNQFPSCDEATKVGKSSIEDERESERELCELEMNESITDSTAKSLPSPQLAQPSSVHSAVYNDDNLNLKYLLLSLWLFCWLAYIYVEYTYFTSHVKFHYWAGRAKRERSEVKVQR